MPLSIENIPLDDIEDAFKGENTDMEGCSSFTTPAPPEIDKFRQKLVDFTFSLFTLHFSLLVAGKSQYFECWNNLWDRYNKGVDEDIDFRLWFHDLFRPSHRPYDPKETERIRRICDLAEQGKE